MDTYDELVMHLRDLLSKDLSYFSAMKSKTELGEIIEIANKEKDYEQKAELFLRLIRS